MLENIELKHSKSINQKGAILLFTTLLVLVVISIISLGVAEILTKEWKTRIFVNDSPLAYYAADSGAERMLYEIYKNDYQPSVDDSGLTFYLTNGSTWTMSVVSSSPLIIRIVGSMGEVSRAIRLDF